MADHDVATRGEIKLSRVAPFRLGQVDVFPATRQLVHGERSETLEPRVMQVLVALAEAGGAVLSREELIDRCWGGRIVGENAINRVISRIRQVAADFGMDSFQLETITKVGYRMVVRGQVPAATAQDVPIPRPTGSKALSRRQLVGGGAAVAAALGAGAILTLRSREHTPSPEALELFRRGQLAQREGLPDQMRQAAAFFKQAVAADPEFAAGWGALALSYRHILEMLGVSAEGDLPSLIRSAAARALSLDGDNADALLALVIIKPYFRNWRVMEIELRRLAQRFPDHWLIQAQLGLLLQDVGRLNDGIEHTRRVIQIDPFIPVSHTFLARAFSCAGRIQEAEATLDAAVRRWPAHPAIWGARYNFLLFNGQAASAAAFVIDPARRPEGTPQAAIDMRLRLARAVELRRPEDVEASTREVRDLALSSVQAIPTASAMFPLLGRPDLAFDSLERYYFGAGAREGPDAPPGALDRRYTIALFAPTMRPYRDHPRYRSLLERVGLEAYWRESRTSPDFRR